MLWTYKKDQPYAMLELVIQPQYYIGTETDNSTL